MADTKTPQDNNKEPSNLKRLGNYLKKTVSLAFNTAGATATHPLKGIDKGAKLIEHVVGKPISFAIEKIAGKETAEKAQKGWDSFKDKIKNSAIGKVVGKAYEVATNSMAGKMIGVGLGIAATVAMGPVAISMASVSGGVQLAVAVKEIRDKRKLHQEHTAINEHKACNNIQEKLLEKNPELKALQENLKQTPTKDKEWVKKNYKTMNNLYDVPDKANLGLKEAAKGAADIGKEVLVDQLTEQVSEIAKVAAEKATEALKENIGDIAKEGVENAVKEGLESTVKEVASNPSPLGLIKTVATFVGGAYEAKEKYEQTLKNNEAKREINDVKKETAKHNMPPYENLTELKESAREKKINTAALMSLVEGKDYAKIKDNPEILKEKFAELKKDISAKTPEVTNEDRGFGAKLLSVAKDIGRSFSMGSKYSRDIEFSKASEIQERYETQGIKPKTKFLDKIKNIFKKEDKAQKNDISNTPNDKTTIDKSKTTSTTTPSHSSESIKNFKEHTHTLTSSSITPSATNAKEERSKSTGRV